MPTFRTLKHQLRPLLAADDWQARAAALDELPPATLFGPLLACLPLGEPVTSRAAALLGRQAGRLYDTGQTEPVRDLIRRLMWHMNEDSGNIGWGIPEAFGEVLAARRALAEQFGRVLLSYIMDTGRADNFCEHPPLRRACYRGILRLAEAWPDLPDFCGLDAMGRRALRLGAAQDPDAECRALAAAGLACLQGRQDPA